MCFIVYLEENVLLYLRDERCAADSEPLRRFGAMSAFPGKVMPDDEPAGRDCDGGAAPSGISSVRAFFVPHHNRQEHTSTATICQIRHVLMPFLYQLRLRAYARIGRCVLQVLSSVMCKSNNNVRVDGRRC